MDQAAKVARETAPKNGCVWVIFSPDSLAVKIRKAKYGKHPNPRDFSEIQELVRLDAIDLRHGANGVIKKAHRLAKRAIRPYEYLPRVERVIHSEEDE